MKKYILPILMVAAVAFFVFEFFIVKKPLPQQTTATFNWENKPHSVLTNFKGAHDAKIYTSLSGSIHLFAVGDGQLRMFTSHDGGDTFDAGIPVSSKDAKISTHGENGPVMAPGNMGPAVIWDQNGDIMSAVSMNEGHSFLKPVRVDDAPKGAFAYTADITSRGKVLFAVWLDARDKAVGSDMSLYFARSDDGGMSWEKNVRIAKGVCECCRPTIAALPDDKLLVVWRNIYSGQIRDIASAVSEDGGKHWKAPVRVAKDHWHIFGCPTSGPRLFVMGKRIYATWFSAGTGKNPGIRFTWTDDEGKTWQKPTIISKSVQDPNHPYLFGNNKHLYVAFQARPAKKQDGKWSNMRAYLAAVQKNGEVSKPTPLPASHTATYPAAAADEAGRLWITWNGKDSVQLLRGRN